MPAGTPTPEEHADAQKALVNYAQRLGYRVGLSGRLEHGALAAIAHHMGITRSLVSQWWKGTRKMTPQRIRELYRANVTPSPPAQVE